MNQKQGAILVNSSGEIQDIVGVGEVNDEDTYEDDVPTKRLADLSNLENISSNIEQTLTITTPDGAVHQAVLVRSFTNLGPDGKPSKTLNENGVNLTVTFNTTTPEVKRAN